jgi:Peptidase M50B-like
MTTAKQSSATPILDLLQPLPEPNAERFTGRFALPFLTVVAFVIFTGNLSFLMVLFGFLLVNFLTIAIHEGGHLLAGWCVGFRFKGVRIDPVRIRADSGKWKFKVRPRLFWGFALMSLDRVRRVRHRLIFLTAGGPAASIFCGMAAVLAGEIGLARYDSSWPAFLDFLGAWSLIIGFIGLVPFRVRGFANDAMLLRALLFSKPEATQLIASYALSALKGDSLFPPDYVPRWFRLAAAQTRMPSGNYYAEWLAYENAQGKDVAAQHLENCLAQSAWMDDGPRDTLIAEATVFTSWRRDDAVKAQVWFKRIKALDSLHPVSQARMRISVLCVQKQFEDAKIELDRALSSIREGPDGKQHQRFKAEWIAWGEQIQQRMPVEV